MSSTWVATTRNPFSCRWPTHSAQQPQVGSCHTSSVGSCSAGDGVRPPPAANTRARPATPNPTNALSRRDMCVSVSVMAESTESRAEALGPPASRPPAVGWWIGPGHAGERNEGSPPALGGSRPGAGGLQSGVQILRSAAGESSCGERIDDACCARTTLPRRAGADRATSC